MKCNKCGAEIPEDSLFCPNCGEKILKVGNVNWNKMTTWCWVAVCLLIIKLIICVLTGTITIPDIFRLGWYNWSHLLFDPHTEVVLDRVSTIVRICIIVMISVFLFIFFHKLDTYVKLLPTGQNTSLFKAVGYIALLEAAICVSLSFLYSSSIGWFVLSIVDCVVLLFDFLFVLLAAVQINNTYMSTSPLMKRIRIALVVYDIGLLCFFAYSVLLSVYWTTDVGVYTTIEAWGIDSPYYLWLRPLQWSILVPGCVFELVFMIMLGLTLKKYGNEAL